MTEGIWFALIIGGLIFWRLGGWIWKGWRRYVWPLFFGCLGISLGWSLWVVSLVTILSHFAYRLPDGIDEGKRVHLFYGLIVAATLPFGCSWWQLITCAGFSVTLLLSNWKHTRKLFPWVVCECIRGGLIGQTIADLYTRGGW